VHDCVNTFDRAVARVAIAQVADHDLRAALAQRLGSSELAGRMNSATKFVVSRKTVDLSWNNSHRLEGDLPVAVSQLKSQPGGDIAILGSGALVAQLTDHALIDEYRLTRGRQTPRQRSDRAPRPLALLSSRAWGIVGGATASPTIRFAAVASMRRSRLTERRSPRRVLKFVSGRTSCGPGTVC
jgi:hypothetical protein